MSERLQSASTTGSHCPKMENDLSPRKTMLVLVIVVGCFAVLWPKVFYPMLVGSANQHIKPSPIDKTTGCCDVISETDVNTIKIMSELCGTIINTTEDKPLTGKEIVQRCRQEVLETCGIDISLVLQEQVRLGQNVKQILDEIRSLNGSLCLKYNYGVAPWRLGVPHRITVKMASDVSNIRQERPLHLRSELIHPAFRERGRAIPQPQVAPPVRPPPRVVEGRPGPVPGMRPTIGGAGHVVPPSKQGTSSMSVIMPIYTIGIVIFFTYTLMKIIFKKQPESVGGSLYPPVDPDPHFRKEVFESESSRLGPRLTRENISSKLVVNAMSALLDEVDQEIEARRKSSEVTSQDLVNGTLSNGDVVNSQDEEQPTVKVLGMEMTASCEGGKKWSRPDSPVLPTSPPPPPAEPVPPPQEIFLEGALPAQSHLLVSDSATEREPTTGEDPAVVLSGKMTLSVISLDSENGVEETVKSAEDTILAKEQSSLIEQIEEDIQVPEEVPVIKQIQEQTLLKPSGEEQVPVAEQFVKNVESLVKEQISSVKQIEEGIDISIQEHMPVTEELQEDIQKSVAAMNQESVVFAGQKPLPEVESVTTEEDGSKIQTEAEETEKPVTELEKDIQDFLQKLKEEAEIQAPAIILECEDLPHTIEVEQIEKEVNNLIEEAIDNIQQREQNIEIRQVLRQETNEISDNSKLIENEKVQSIEQIPETNDKQTNFTVLNDIIEKENVASPKVELGEIISNEIENLIREVKEMPIIESKSEENHLKLDSKVDVRTEDDKTDLTPTSAELRISGQQIPEDILQASQIEEKTNLTEDVKHVPKDSEESLPELQEDILKSSGEIIRSINVGEEEKPKPDSEVTLEPISSEEIKTPEVIEVETTPVKSPTSGSIEEKELLNSNLEGTTPSSQKSSEYEDDELGSDEEVVEEIEEIVYEEESEEEEEEEIEVEVEEEESEEEIPDERNTNRTESSSVQRINGERSEDLVESKYTTVSGATAAENDISDEELTDNEEVEEDEEEVIEIEEELEDDDYIVEEGNDVNHISGESDPEL